MFKILVADDENIVIESIKYIIEKNFSDVVIAGTARTGREAIEKAEALKPDLILMDIKMPGINGIDAIKEIKSSYSNALFIIISASEQFEFAKEAVNLGVFEYLLKPVNRMKIVEIIRKATQAITESRQKRKKELEIKEKMESLVPILEQGFIYSILLFEDFDKALEKYRTIFEINEEGGYFMTIEFGEEESPGTLGNVIGSSVLSQSFYPNFRDIIKSRCRCIVGPVMLNRIVIFVLSDKEEDEYVGRLEALSIAEYLLKNILEKVNADFYIGIGSKTRGNENLLKSYEESLRAIKFASQKGIVHIKDIADECETRSEYPLAKEKYLIEKAGMGETSECIQTFLHIFDWLVIEYKYSVKDIKYRLTELIVMFHRLAYDYGIEESEQFKRQNYLTEFLSIDEIATLKIWCKNRIDFITGSIKNIRIKRLSYIVTNAKDYININFNKELTLEDVSKEVKLSPHYFSKFFKEETGENFIDYLTTLRIGKAKDFLESGQFSVKEVSYKVGYNDPNYFSRIFKKMTGYTPTDFKF